MANTCFTTITITHKNERKVKDFFEKVDTWAKKGYLDNDYNRPNIDYWWLGNIVGNSGIAKWTKKENGDSDFVPNIRCRGMLTRLELNGNQIIIDTETAWSPMLEMWQLLCQKYLRGAEIYYTADEGGNELYQTNDPDMIGKYYIDIIDNVPEEFDDIAESEYEATEEMVIKLLQRVLHSDETDIKKLLDLLDESDVEDWLHIHKWETVEIAEIIDCE